MTYMELLLVFVVAPIVALALLLLQDEAPRRNRRARWQGRAPVHMLAILVIVATVYTLPWDNHLIALHVWSYGPALISGVRIGVIPLEEVLFFPLQTTLVGLWQLWLARRLTSDTTTNRAGHEGNQFVDENHERSSGGPRRRGFDGAVALVSGALGCLWLGALVILWAGWRPGTYLGWELAWALPPLIAQVSVGAHVIWRARHMLWAALVPVCLYLYAMDALALYQRIWIIDPHQSLDILVGGLLPIEEIVFFTLTSALVAFGMVLGVARVSLTHGKAPELAHRTAIVTPEMRAKQHIE